MKDHGPEILTKANDPTYPPIGGGSVGAQMQASLSPLCRTFSRAGLLAGRPILLLLLLLVVATPGCSLNPLEPSSDRTTTAISIIASQAGTGGLYISVADQNGAPLEASRFSPQNFGISYAGQRVEAGSLTLTSTSSSGRTVSSALVLDYSGSMAQDRHALEEAASAFVGAMAGADRAAVIKFDTNVVSVQPFTSDKTALQNAIPTDPFSFNGSTALYDAVYRGIQDASAESGQRAVVAFTDGLENASRTIRSPGELVAAALFSSVPVFTIGLGAVNDTELRQIANGTGGRYYRAPTAGDLAAIYQQVAKTFAETMELSWSAFVYQPGVTIAVDVAYTSANGVHFATTSVVLH